MNKLKHDKVIDFVEHHMFLITLLLYLINFKTQTVYFGLGSWEINRTVGWGWDISIYFWYSLFGSFFIFTIGYGIVKLLKRKTSYQLSIGHIVSMILYILVTNFFGFSDVGFLTVGLVMWLFFILNVYKSTLCKI